MQTDEPKRIVAGESEVPHESRLALPGRTGIHDPTVAIAVVVSIVALICADRYTDATPFLCSN